jgi:steroid delta-isomerase
MTATPDQIRATVDAYVAAYRNNDKAALLACYADDCEWHDPVGTPSHHGLAGIDAFWDGVRQMVERLVLVPSAVYVCGNEACMVMEIHSTMGGTEMVLDAVDVFVFDDDAKIVSGKAYWELEKARTA